QCHKLIQEHGPNYDDYFPPELNVLVGKKVLWPFQYTNDHIENNNYLYQVKLLSVDEAMLTHFKKDFILEDGAGDLQTPLLDTAKSSRFSNVANILFNLEDSPQTAHGTTEGNGTNTNSEGNSKETENDGGDSGSGKRTIIDLDDYYEKPAVAKRNKVSSRVLNEKAMLQKYQQWMVRYGRAYRDNKERVMRFKIFKDNVAYIEDFNSEHSAYKLSINKFADQTKEEFIATHTGFKVPSTLRLAQNMKFRYDMLGQTQVLSSCWAISTFACYDRVLLKSRTGKLNSLFLVQDVEDCDKNRTCNHIKEAVHAAIIVDMSFVPANNESALLKAVDMPALFLLLLSISSLGFIEWCLVKLVILVLIHAVTAVGVVGFRVLITS
ncbi:senescence-specific cysteine protease SAG39-like protein, partial [Tanacetum coccineum]